MADKTIGQLQAATQVTPLDLFVLEQSGTAKKLTGQILENWLVSFADGHGGIQSIVKTGTSGLVDTYTITLADTTTTTFSVTNGKTISAVTTYYAVSESGSIVPSTWSTTRQSMTAIDRYLWSYQKIDFNDGSDIETVKTVIGVWGDKGDTGDTGRGIVDLEQTSRVPKQYTVYTFEMNDGTTETFTVYDGVGIQNIARTSTVGLVDTYTITYSDDTTTTFTVTNAKSITSVTLTGTVGLVDTYTVSFNDGSSTTFTVTNGASIQSIEKTATSGLVDTYTVTLTNGDTTTFTVTNAKSIVSVTMVSGTHAPGTTDTYRITFNDGDTSEFTVYNGANGTGAVSTVDGINPDGNQNVRLMLTGNGAPTSSTVGQLYQRYFDLSSQILYICVGVNKTTTPATYSWAGTGVPVDSALSMSSQNPVQNAVITAKVGTVTLTTISVDLSSAVNELNNTKAKKIVIASIYNSSQTYAVGDYCLDGTTSSLYRCVTAITTPEAWTAEHWTQTTVGAELKQKYEKPSGGIPKTDFASDVQTSLGKADTALQAVPSTYRTAAAQDVIDAGKAAASSIPNAGSVSSAGVISIKHDNTELFTVQLPLYDGSVSNGT